MARRNDSPGNSDTRGSFRRKGSGSADWQSVDSKSIQSAICAASSVGGALRFGYSRDGGAYAIGIYKDGEQSTEFVRPSEDMEAFLEELCEFFSDGKRLT